MSRVSVRLCLVAVAIVILGCNDKPLPSGPPPGARQIAKVEKYSGDTQTAIVNSPVPIRPAILVTDSAGRPIEGITVSFSLVLGAGSLTNADVTTDRSGVAAVGSWVLGTKSGPNSLRVTVADTNILTFSATGTAGPPASITAETSSPILGAAGAPLAVHPTVRVADAYDNPNIGVTVMFQVTAGGGSASGPAYLTNDSGFAALGTWTLGTTAGNNTLQAKITGVNPVSFLAIGTAGSPASLTAVTSLPFLGIVGAPLAAHPAVRVADIYGNPIPGVAIVFQVTSGGGSVTGLPDSTNALGLAALGTWTLGPVAGDNTLQAGATGLTPVSFLAKGTAAAPVTIAKLAGDSQLAGLQAPVRTPPTVQVRDAYGNLVGGATVRFSVASGGGTVADSIRLTDSTGTAHVGAWMLGSIPGPNTLKASISNGQAATFTADAIDMCTESTAYTIGTTINDSLTTSGCVANGEYTNRYAFSVGAPASLRFDMTSAAYSSRITVFDSSRTLIATTPDYCDTYYCGGTDSVRVLVPAGAYFAGSGGFVYDYGDSPIGGVVGPYTLSATSVPEDVNGCSDNPIVYVTPGVTTAQRVDSTDCAMLVRSYRFFYDRIGIFMTAGKTYTITMTSNAFDTYLELYQGNYSGSWPYGYVVAYSDDFGGSSNSQITFTATASGIYTIAPETYDGDMTGAYTLSVSVTGAAASGQRAPAMAPPPHTASRAAPVFNPRPPKP